MGWYAIRREHVAPAHNAEEEMANVEAVWLVPAGDPQVLDDALTKMRDHEAVHAGRMRVRLEQITWHIRNH